MRAWLLAALVSMLFCGSAQAQYYWGWWAEPMGQVGDAGPLNWSMRSNQPVMQWLHSGHDPSEVPGHVARTDTHPVSGSQYSNTIDYTAPRVIRNPFVDQGAGSNVAAAPAKATPALPRSASPASAVSAVRPPLRHEMRLAAPFDPTAAYNPWLTPAGSGKNYPSSPASAAPRD